MAYAVKYRIEYKDNRGTNKKIDILENGYTGDVVDIVPGEDPLQIDAPDLVTMFDPIVFIGATINVLSASDLQLTNLYSIDPKKYMVKVYAGSATDPFWIGFLNTEGYREPYTTLADYPVSLECNNGFSVLKRFKFLSASGDRYTGFKSYWQILEILLDKMGIPFLGLGFASGIKPDGVTIAANETLFHKLKANTENYYDESGEAMNCLQVLEELLKPFPLQIRQHCGYLYIYGPNALASSSIAFKMYGPTLAYTGTINLDRAFDIATEEVFWSSDDQKLEYISGACKQKITYSPYCYEEAAEYVDISDAKNWTGTPVWTQYGSGEGTYYKMTGITSVAGYAMSGALTSFGGRATVIGGRDNEGDDEYFFQRPYGDGVSVGVEFLRSLYSRHLAGTRSSCVRVHGKIFVQSKEFYSDDQPVGISSVTFSYAIKCGNKYANFNGTDVEWQDSQVKYNGRRVRLLSSPVCDDWMDFSITLPWNLPPGNLEFVFYDDFRAYQPSRRGYTPTVIGDRIQRILFKDIRFIICDCIGFDSGLCSNLGPAELKDIEFTGKINEDFENEASAISLIHGDGVNVADRGAIFDPNLAYVTGWRDTGDTESYELKDLLLRSIISQNRETNLQLSGTVDAPGMFESVSALGFFSVLEDSARLTGKRLACIGGSYSDFYGTMFGTFREIRANDLTIEVEE